MRKVLGALPSRYITGHDLKFLGLTKHYGSAFASEAVASYSLGRSRCACLHVV